MLTSVLRLRSLRCGRDDIRRAVGIHHGMSFRTYYSCHFERSREILVLTLLFFLFNNMLSGLAEDVSYMIVVK